MRLIVEPYDAMFALKNKQGIPLCDTALGPLPIILWHRLEGEQESSALFLNEVDRP